MLLLLLKYIHTHGAQSAEAYDHCHLIHVLTHDTFDRLCLYFTGPVNDLCLDKACGNYILVCSYIALRI